MTPSAVQLKIVRERLDYAAARVRELRELPQESESVFLADKRNPLAADSLLRHAIEAIFDTARHLLAKGFGVGKLEYREIARECAERGLVRDEVTAQAFRGIAGYRNRLVHHYDDITPHELYDILQNRLGDLEAVVEELRAAGARLASK